MFIININIYHVSVSLLSVYANEESSKLIDVHFLYIDDIVAVAVWDYTLLDCSQTRIGE